MSLQSQDVVKKMLARGIDSYSARSNILDGYAEDVVNMTTSASGQVAKRPGYEGHRGWIPLRVKKIQHAGTNIRLTFDDSQSIDLTEIGIGPIVVRGKLPAADAPGGGYAGDFSTTNQVHYYDTYSVTNRDAILAPTGTLTKTANDHGISSPYIFTGLARSDDLLSSNHTVLGVSNTAINTTTYQVDVDYINPLASDGFFYYLDKSAEAGTTYIHNVAAPSTSETVNANVHNLTNFNIGVRCYDTTISGTQITEVCPSLVSIDASGNVTIDFASGFEGDIVLTACPLANVASAVPITGVNTITISVSDTFNFFYIYAFNGGTSTFESVLPSNISYDASTGLASIEYLLAAASESVEIYYEAANIIANVIELTDTGAVSETYTSLEPQLSVWGIDHDGIYKDITSRGGHVSHIDNYKSLGEEKLICGLGGNFYEELPYATGSTSHLMPSAYASLRERVEGDTELAPLFAPSAVHARTRGLVIDASIDSSFTAMITAATYVSSGVVDYTLSFTNKNKDIVVGGNPATEGVISTYDKLTVSNMANSIHNGSFTISSVQSNSATSCVIRVANADVLNAITDEAGASGRGGVFTDVMTLENPSYFIRGDSVSSTAVASTYSLTAVAVNAEDLYVSGVTDNISLPDGVRIFGSRNCYIVPLRDREGIATVENYVRGDMLEVTDLAFKPRVVNVNTKANIALTLTGDGTTVTAVSATAHGLAVGNKIAIINSAVFNCTAQVTAVADTTTFTFSHSASGASTGDMLGKCIELDTRIPWSDGALADTFTVVGRWSPIEAPTSAYDLVKPTYVYHLDSLTYANQLGVRSTMMNDNLYLSNYYDEVMKVDGSNLYRAGLPRWQPALFAHFDTSPASLLKGHTEVYSAISNANHSFTVPVTIFTVGDRIYDSNTSATYTVSRIDVTSGTDKIFIVETNPTLSMTGSDELTIVKRYKYYARLNMIDANNNVIATAATGHNDTIVEQTVDGQIHLKLVGMAPYGNYDYDRIEYELYRTKANGAIFYRITHGELSFDNSEGYIEVEDGTPDDHLIETELDSVHSALAGAELGVAWNDIPRAKYLTSAANRLLLANLKSYPQWDITILPTGASVTASNINGFTVLFRKTNTDTSTTTNMVDRVKYQYINTGATTIVPANITTTATTFTVPTGSPPAVGSWVYLFHSVLGATKEVAFSGWYQVASVTAATSFTCKANHGLGTGGGTASDTDRFITATVATDVPVWLGTDGNYGQITVNSAASQQHELALRLSNAINATMRMTDITIAGQEDFTPWLLAGGGEDYQLGQIHVEVPIALTTTPEVRLGTVASTFKCYVNNYERATNEEVSSSVYTFPSRVAISYENYPEIFDSYLVTNSDSTVDVNSADGQQITGIIPFFGESTFGQGSLNQVVVVFKTSSIYLLDVVSRDVMKIDSRGLGCTAPYSIAPTKSGIMFANKAGIYRLNRDMSISFVGKMMKGKWDLSVNKDAISEAYGHQYGLKSQYKLSVPTGTELYNNEAYVYDHELEGQGQEYGAWVRYTEHAATGWVNQDNDAFMATRQGDVFIIKNTGEVTDYRDDATAIASSITLRPEDFDLPGVRKAVSGITTQLEYETCTGLTIQTAVNLSSTFEDAGSVTSSTQEDLVVRASPATRKGTYIQVKYDHATIDENLTIAGVSYSVARLDTRGVTQTADRK
jgi:hypothetical protein